MFNHIFALFTGTWRITAPYKFWQWWTDFSTRSRKGKITQPLCYLKGIFFTTLINRNFINHRLTLNIDLILFQLIKYNKNYVCLFDGV